MLPTDFVKTAFGAVLFCLSFERMARFKELKIALSVKKPRNMLQPFSTTTK